MIDVRNEMERAEPGNEPAVRLLRKRIVSVSAAQARFDMVYGHLVVERCLCRSQRRGCVSLHQE